MNEDVNGERRQPPPLFGFLAVLAVALARRKLTAQQGGIALLIAITSRGTTGEHAVIDAEQLALEVGLSERQVWRHFAVLVERGWFVQTKLPKRPAKGERGQRARYRLTQPALNLGLGSLPDRVTSASAERAHGHSASAEPSDSSDRNRLTFPAPSCDITQRRSVTVTASLGTPSNDSPAEGISCAPSTEDACEDACEDAPNRRQANAMREAAEMSGRWACVAVDDPVTQGGRERATGS
jgi:hypothetical protein